ncbi:MAG: glycoside hydrolase family 88 protein [Coprobacter sp.]|nr:glycoside hydrolase family 88 protein [Coprobacter sp.]
MNTKNMLLGLGACLLSSCACDKCQIDTTAELDYCKQQVERTLDDLRDANGNIDYTMTPFASADSASKWRLNKVCKEEWRAGFWPGTLWYTYEHTQDATIKAEAEKFTEELEFLSKTPAHDHDLGFLIFCSYGNGYRLTGNPTYKQVILDTADTLATLFNPAVGTILSWPRHLDDLGGHNTIMDNMINLEMLFWAAKNGGNPRLADIARAHADKTMQCHFMPNYVGYHVAIYNPTTGDFIRGCTHQGYADNTMWARGQSWAIYGYTMVYRETGDPKYLDFAQKVTDVYLSQLPEDFVPYWDFSAPGIPDAPRDASAAAIVASGLLELSTYVDAEKAKIYKNAAVKMLTSLSSDTYKGGAQKSAFLRHATGHYPAGSDIDASLIYADYYYIEALLRLQRLEESKTILG